MTTTALSTTTGDRTMQLQTVPSTPAAPDIAAIKARQQVTWASGDYHVIATQVMLPAELLVETLHIRPTERVLDVATGSGNAALAVARRGAPVIGVDYVPALLDRARRRMDAEGVDGTFVEGDAEALPFGDGAFDVVTSVFGAMFAPDQEQTARELVRVCRPGGRIGLVAHTPEGFIGRLLATVSRHVPPPAGLASPLLWGTEPRLAMLFGPEAVEIRARRRHVVFRYPSPDAWLETWRRYYGPTLKAFEAVGEAGREALEADLLDLVDAFNDATDVTMAVRSEYLEAVIDRR
jgi:SAM-dependent methyltransferase